MGRVYRARDRRLGRIVAVKVLAPELAPNSEAVARLRREAEAASSLNHPSIVTIYDIGEAAEHGSLFYITMELIDGVNVREWLRQLRTPVEIVDAMLQTATGLAAAHARSIIHRDIKPENIMITDGGVVKLVDFGLAKVAAPRQFNDTGDVTDLRLTEEGRVLGTMTYMSPEQMRGEPLDHTTDIFSFGCVLHEAFAGRAPFAAASAPDTISRILRGEPDPLPRGTNPMIAAIVQRCLAKERNQRYASMEQVITELRRVRESLSAPRFAVKRWLAAAAVAFVVITGALIASRMPFRSPSGKVADASIAVLPFHVVGPASDGYLADGISDALTTDLARQPDLTVIARNSAQHFSGDVDLQRAADDLRVRYLLVGSVQNIAGKLRVNARLVDSATQKHVWADVFERPLSDAFAAESDIVRAVAQRLAPKTAPAANREQPSDPRVAELYLKARFYAEDALWPTKDKSIPLLEEVARLDPAFMPARIELARQYQRRAFVRDPDRSWEQKAYVEVEKILAANPREASAYVIRGNQKWVLAHGFAHDEALSDYDRALALDPQSLEAYNSRASVYMHVGMNEEALADYGRVLRVDPFNDFARMRVGRIHLYQRKCAQAVAELRKTPANSGELTMALDCAGRTEEAFAEIARQKAAGRYQEDIAASHAVLLAKSGRRNEALEAIRIAVADGEGGSHFHHAMYRIALAYAQMHDAGNALKWLQRTASEGMPCYTLFATDPLLNPVRSDARIQKLLDDLRIEFEQRRARRAHAG